MALPLREAGRNIVIDICQLYLEVVCLGQDLLGAIVGVLACSCQLGTGLQQGSKQVLDAHADLLLAAPLIPLGLHNACHNRLVLEPMAISPIFRVG